MTHDFIYHNPTKVYFGNGMLAHLPEEISRLGSRVLLITGGSSAKKSGLFDKVLTEISKANVDCYGLSGVKPNPEIGLVREGIRLVREKRLDLILALGGGSVLDTAKVIAGSAPYDADPWDLIRSRAAIDTALPLITIPTIAATGSEMNASAVITNPETEENTDGPPKPSAPPSPSSAPKTPTPSPPTRPPAAPPTFSPTSWKSTSRKKRPSPPPKPTWKP